MILFFVTKDAFPRTSVLGTFSLVINQESTAKEIVAFMTCAMAKVRIHQCKITCTDLSELENQFSITLYMFETVARSNLQPAGTKTQLPKG